MLQIPKSAEDANDPAIISSYGFESVGIFLEALGAGNKNVDVSHFSCSPPSDLDMDESLIDGGDHGNDKATL
jgi:hypothetical protein